MSPNETDLRAGLRREADRVDAVGDFATAAIALERRRGRRRQVTAVAAGVVAALAVAVPIAISAGRGTSPVRPVPASATSSEPTPTSGPTPTSEPAPTSAPTSEPGPPPTVPSVDASTIFALDDTIRVGDKVFHLEKGTQVENLSVLANGGFVLQSHLTSGASQSELELLSPQGHLVKPLGVSGSYAVSADGTRVAAQDGQSMKVTVVAPDGSGLGTRTDDRTPVAVVGDYVYLGGDSTTKSVEWNYVTGQTRTLPGHVVAVAADRSRAALQWMEASADPMGDFCWAVIDLTRADFRTLIERCGKKGNPELFQPTAFSSDAAYLVGSNYVDGGFWFSAAVVRVSDGAMVLGGAGDRVVAGWTWRFDDDGLVISRNTSAPKSEENTLQRCSLDLNCTQVAPPLMVAVRGGTVDPRYVVPRSIPQ
jgi:hypothetical protein